MILVFFICSCSNVQVSYRLDNLKNTRAERIGIAIEEENLSLIEDEIRAGISPNFMEPKYQNTLLSLAIANRKKKSFVKLLELGANPNFSNSYCETPYHDAIRTISNCDLYYIQKMAKLNYPKLPKNFHDCPINKTTAIQKALFNFYLYDESEACDKRILEILIKSSPSYTKILHQYNTSNEFKANLVYHCLETRNIEGLRFMVKDLGLELPEKIFVDKMVLGNSITTISILEILNHQNYVLKNPKNIKAKKELLEFL